MTLKSVTLKPGECFILPKDATVQSVVIDGAITVTSDCSGALPAPVSYKCGVFYFFISKSSSDAGPLDEENTYYTSLTVNDNIYSMSTQKVADGNNPGTMVDISVLNTYITDPALFAFTAIATTTLTERERVAVYFKVPEDLFSKTTLQISDRGTLYNLPPNEATCGSYPAPA